MYVLFLTKRLYMKVYCLWHVFGVGIASCFFDHLMRYTLCCGCLFSLKYAVSDGALVVL